MWASAMTTSALLMSCAWSDDSTTQESPGAGANPPATATPERYGRVPPRAELAAHGLGRLKFKAPSDGRVWVGNASRKYEVLSHWVSRGDVVEVIPERDLVELNDQPVYQENLEKLDQHEVYFLANGRWDGSSGGNIKPYDGIPGRASSVATGYGRIEWRAEQAGRVWIGNDKLAKVIMTRDVRAGDLVEVDAAQDQVKINGKVVYDQNLESKHQHSVFFR
jgi:hypothetical protein